MALKKNSPSKTVDPEGDKEFLKDSLKKNDPVKMLAKHVAKVWRRNQKDFKPVRKEMVKALRRVKGEYDPQKLQAIRAFKGSEAYLRTGEQKCRSAESWIKDIYRGDKDIPWAVEPTAVPDLPEKNRANLEKKAAQQASVFEQQMMQQHGAINPDQVAEMIQMYYEQSIDREVKRLEKDAKKRCDRASKQIRDQNQEGGWNKAFEDFLYWFVRVKFGVIKGPVLTKKTKMEWGVTAEGKYELQPKDVLANTVYAVSPFNFFPQKDMVDINDGDIIEIHELSRQGIADLLGVPGYSDDEINTVLNEYDKGDLKGRWFEIEDETTVKSVLRDKLQKYDSKPTTQEGKDDRDDVILAQELTGSVEGKLLKEWGMEGNLEDNEMYQTNCWKIGNHVIKAMLNPDPLGRKNYHISSWAKNPQWIIGEGLIEFGATVEDCINAILRALINNIAIASGPMSEINGDRVDSSIPIYPWRQIVSSSLQMSGNEGPAVNYYQPNMHANELMQALEFFFKVLDNMTVPAYAQGAAQSGVTAGTATVFTQLLAAASRSIKAVVANIDSDIIAPYIQMCYEFNMQNTEDESTMGDARAVAKGIQGLLAKEQAAQRKVEFLQIALTPTLAQILGPKNLGALAAQIAKSGDIDLPDMDRLDGSADLDAMVQQLIMAGGGVDVNQMNGQMAQGGGAPQQGQGMNPDGSKAGVVNG